MSNFDFLKDFDNTLYKLGQRIERQVTTSPSGVTADATKFLEHILKKLLGASGLTYTSTKTFYSQIDAVYRAGTIGYGYKNKIYSAYRLRSKIHGEFDETEKTDVIVALNLHEKLFYIAKKYYRDFNENYDGYKGLPTFKPIELDTSDDEIELVKIPDFTEIVDVNYDYCVICGKPNRSSYLLCCPDCSRVLDNANNFISIRNEFGKDAQFTKDDLIEFGIPEGYVNQLISHLVREDMLKVKGRFITFNNMNFDSYLRKIDSYLAVGELITKFMEDKITPAEIKETREYKLGSIRQEPFYEFYKIINHEVINKFESDLLTTEDIWKSIEYTTISQKQLERWYNIQLGNYNRGKVNESFVVFNDLLIEDYIDLKRQGILEKDIKSRLNISTQVYEFFTKFKPDFEKEIAQIKKNLLLDALSDGKTRAEAIEIAGVTPKEYDDLVKYSNFKGDDFSQRYHQEVESRKKSFVGFLKDNDLQTSAELAKITVDDFYKWYDKSDLNSPFYLESTRILMDKFLDERKTGKTKADACDAIGLDVRYVDKWLTRSLEIYREFKDEYVQVTVNLILDGFKHGKSKRDISDYADVSVNTINGYLKLGKRGSQIHKELYDYYEDEVVPKALSRFLVEIQNKSFKKSLEIIELSEDDFSSYYNLGRAGNENYRQFYEDYFEFKKDTYVSEVIKGKSEVKAFKKANFLREEFDEIKDDLDRTILFMRIDIVKKEILNDSTTEKAARKAGVSVDDIYDWYYLGKSDEEFSEFSEFFFSHYIEPNILHFNRLVNQGKPIDKILKVFDINFTKKDFEIWQKEGLINKEDIVVKLDEDGEDDEDDENKLIRRDGYNSKLYETINDDDDDDEISSKDIFFPSKRPSKAPGILKKNDVDVEKLKREILKK